MASFMTFGSIANRKGRSGVAKLPLYVATGATITKSDGDNPGSIHTIQYLTGTGTFKSNFDVSANLLIVGCGGAGGRGQYALNASTIGGNNSGAGGGGGGGGNVIIYDNQSISKSGNQVKITMLSNLAITVADTSAVLSKIAISTGSILLDGSLMTNSQLIASNGGNNGTSHFPSTVVTNYPTINGYGYGSGGGGGACGTYVVKNVNLPAYNGGTSTTGAAGGTTPTIVGATNTIQCYGGAGGGGGGPGGVVGSTTTLLSVAGTSTVASIAGGLGGNGTICAFMNNTMYGKGGDGGWSGLNGGWSGKAIGTNGLPNTGNGGSGGLGHGTDPGGTGGSGIVVIQVTIPQSA